MNDLEGKKVRMIGRSTAADLTEVLNWLAQEAAEGNSTFHPNRGLISEGHDEGDLVVMRDQGRVVAFSLGAPGVIDIFETRPDCRGRGYGRVLADHCIERAAAANMAAIEFECAPDTSLPFWQAMGFEEIPAPYGYNPWVMLRVGKRYPLPAGTPVEVVIRTFDEEVMYDQGIEPLHEYRPAAVRTENDVVHLLDRVVLHEPGLPRDHDLAVEIKLGGERLVLDKAKRAKLAAFGVRHDRFRQYFVDRIDPHGKAED